jgi:hypothetical protein
VPRTLERLVIYWEFMSSQNEDQEPRRRPSGSDLPDLAVLCAAVTARCPALKFLWLDGHDFMVHWRTSPDGTVERSARNMRARRRRCFCSGVLTHYRQEEPLPCAKSSTTYWRRYNEGWTHDWIYCILILGLADLAELS